MSVSGMEEQDQSREAGEWLAVLKHAAAHSLVDPSAASQLMGQAACGLLTADEIATRATSLLAAGEAPVRALQTIAGAFAPGDVTELRALDPVGQGTAWHLSGRLDAPEERDRLRDFIHRHIGRHNLYFGANPRKPEMAGSTRAGRSTDVAARRIVVLDLDLKDAPKADPGWSQTRGRLRKLGPLLELDSGNGFHLWFRIEDVDGAALSASVAPLTAAMKRLGADNMADPPRIARLPYTLNIPTKSKRGRGAVLRLALPISEAAPCSTRH